MILLKKKLILDANAFILNQDLQNLAQKYDLYTHEDIIEEVKDLHARKQLEQYEDLLKFKNPSQTSLNKVKTFAQKTGDIASLSKVDILLIAIAYTLIEESGQTNLLRKEPIELTQQIPDFANDLDKKEVENVEIKLVDEDGFQIVKTKKQIQQEKLDLINKQKAEEEEKLKQLEIQKENEKNESEVDNHDDYESESDDGKGWINQFNINKVLNNAVTQDQDDNKINLGIMTSDFSIQNVVIQMGIQLIATDGMVIKKAKRFVLECYSCFRICRDPTKKFCPTCANNTLLKLSCSLNADGTFKFYRKKGHKVRTTGNIYSIPKPVGGRKNNDLILREDEFLMHGRDIKIKVMEKQKEKNFEIAQIEFENGMSFKKKKNQNDQNLQIGYGRKNINAKKNFQK